MSAKKSSMFTIIGASSVGTMIEWYDFYIFGSLATIISTKFFPSGPGNETLSFLSTLATFAAGFIVRPFGALFFGRLGDLIGRKYTFMVTLLLMGGATFMIGLIPSYESIGIIAPLLVLLLRLLQGLALGGEYGGAATYVAEHSPADQRGYMTSWIQITATAGLIISLIVIAITKTVLSKEAFNDYGWRIPFLSGILISVCGIYLKFYCQDDEILPGHHTPVPTSEEEHEEHEQQKHAEHEDQIHQDKEYDEHEDTVAVHGSTPPLPMASPTLAAFSAGASLVPSPVTPTTSPPSGRLAFHSST